MRQGYSPHSDNLDHHDNPDLGPDNQSGSDNHLGPDYHIPQCCLNLSTQLYICLLCGLLHYR